MLLAVGVVGAVLVSQSVMLLEKAGVMGMDGLNALINKRGLVQYLELAMAFVLAGVIAGKFLILKRQWADIAASPLAGVDLRSDEAQRAVREAVLKDPRFASSILLRRIERAINLWLGNKNVDRLTDWLSMEHQRESMVSDSSFALSRYLAWAIPILGFIGTVQGLATAVSGFSVMGGATDLLAIKGSIGQVTKGLGVAFDTTLLALMLTIPLVLLLTWIQRNEENFFVAVDHYLDEFLLARLPSSDRQPIVIENLEDAMEAAFRRYIPDPDRYDEVFTRAIERASQSVEARFANLARDYEATLRDMTTQLGEHLAAVTEVTAGAVGNMLNEVRQVGREETDRFRAMLAEVEQKSGAVLEKYQANSERLHATAAGASTELASRLAEVARLAAGVQELLRVEQSVQRALENVAAGQDLQRTLADLRRHAEVSTALCQQLSKPRSFTLSESSSPKG